MITPFLAHAAPAASAALIAVCLGLVAASASGYMLLAGGVPGPSLGSRHLLATGAGFAATVIAFSPVVESAAESAFAPPMVQHLLLVSAAAPLFALGRTGSMLVASLGARRTPRAVRAVRAVVHRAAAGGRAIMAATGVSVLTLWLWHAPPLYEAATADATVHGLEHVTLFVSALWFWVAILRRRSATHVALAALLVGAIAHSLLGGLITFAPRPLYPSYVTAGLADQQLAGVLMWVPGGLVHLAAGVVLVFTLFEATARRTDLRETARRPVLAGTATDQGAS